MDAANSVESGPNEKTERSESPPPDYSTFQNNKTEIKSDNPYLILTQPTSISTLKSDFLQTQTTASMYNSTLDSTFDNLKQLNKFFFKSTDRVDTAKCQLNIENENGRNLYSVQIGFYDPKDKPFDPNLYVGTSHMDRKITDFHEAMGSSQVLEMSRTIFYSFTDTSTAQVVMQVRKENGNMIARLRNTTLGQVHEDSWYKTPTFTAISGFSGTSNFIITSSKGCLVTNCFACWNQTDFRISSTGIEVGRISWSPCFDNTQECCLAFTQTLDGNSKGLLLAAGVMIYIAHFGHAGCNGGSTGQRGAYCCCQVL